MGMDPDPWQRDVLTSTDPNLMLLCSRQAGKSQTMASLALVEALTFPHSEILIVSRSLRQSVELLRKVKELWRGLTGGRVHRRARFNPSTLKAETVEADDLIRRSGWDLAAVYGSAEVRDVISSAFSG